MCHARCRASLQRACARVDPRKTRSTLAQVLDFGNVAPNVARDRSRARSPRRSIRAAADHVESVYRLLLATTSSRCSDSTGLVNGLGSIESRRGYDEPRRRARPSGDDQGAACSGSNSSPPRPAEAIEATCRGEDRDLQAPLFAGADARSRTAIGRKCKATGTPLWSPHHLRHRRHLTPPPSRRSLGPNRRVRRPTPSLIGAHRRGRVRARSYRALVAERSR